LLSEAILKLKMAANSTYWKAKLDLLQSEVWGGSIRTRIIDSDPKRRSQKIPPDLPDSERSGFDNVCDILYAKSLKNSSEVMMVPTVLRGFLEVVFYSMEIAGESPSMESTSGLCISPRNWRA